MRRRLPQAMRRMGEQMMQEDGPPPREALRRVVNQLIDEREAGLRRDIERMIDEAVARRLDRRGGAPREGSPNFPPFDGPARLERPEGPPRERADATRYAGVRTRDR